MTPPKENAIRRQSWTARGNKVAYFTGAQWDALCEGATKAGYTTTKKVNGQQTTVPDVIGYLMHLHNARTGAPSE